MTLTQQLTPEGNQALQDLAQRYGVSIDAVRTLLFAVSAGGGTLAQFSHSELGGSGQWMRGGMTMVGDMFNDGLKATVSGLCSELSSLLSSQKVFVLPPRSTRGATIAPGNAWWPAELGSPSASGGQNEARYAYFPPSHRLAILHNGEIKLYDTLDHQIRGVQQQQGGYSGSLTFTSQHGTFSVDTLPLVGPKSDKAIFESAAASAKAAEPAPAAKSQQDSVISAQSYDDILKALERLADLHQKGILSEEEFRSKKAELLSRL